MSTTPFINEGDILTELVRTKGIWRALEELGHLPTSEYPVSLHPLWKSGYGLFLYLEDAPDLRTLGLLADSTNRADLIRRAAALSSTSDSPAKDDAEASSEPGIEPDQAGKDIPT